MRLEAIACNQCGAPLSVPEAAQFVRCNHCSASLAVRRSDSVTYTEVVEKLVEHTSKLAEQVAHLRFENELERIDRDWEYERKKLLVRQKDGSLVKPTRGGAIFLGAAFVIVGCIASTLCIAKGAWPFAVFGVVVVVIGMGAAHMGIRAADHYESARMRYLGRRESLKIDDFRGDDDTESIGSESIDEGGIPPLR